MLTLLRLFFFFLAQANSEERISNSGSQTERLANQQSIYALLYKWPLPDAGPRVVYASRATIKWSLRVEDGIC